MSHDRRTALRIPEDRQCKVYVPGSASIMCTIADRSEDGAKLIFEGELPADDLLLMAIGPQGDLWSGAVRWREGNTLGVQFQRGIADLLD